MLNDAQDFVGISDALVISLIDGGWDVVDVSYDYTTIPITPCYKMAKRFTPPSDTDALN